MFIGGYPSPVIRRTSRRSGQRPFAQAASPTGSLTSGPPTGRSSGRSANSATHGCLAGSDLLASTALDAGSGAVLTTTRTYEFGARLAAITNATSGGVVTSHAYDYDNAHRRTKATLHDGSYWDYAYNDRNELIGGGRKWPGGSPVSAQQFGYAYDSIGNRLSETLDSNVGPASRLSHYTVNSLNQVTKRTVPGAVDILGSAGTNALVTVNNQAAVRQGEYFHREVGVNNNLGAAYPEITVSAVQNHYGQEDEDIVDEATGHAFVPENPEQLYYDEDGNLIGDGRWSYAWDGENRLKAMEAWAEVLDDAKRKLTFTYDFQGRRTAKVTYDWNTSTNGWQEATSQRFTYDGWNLLASFNDSTSLTLQRSYLWGSDLSGTMDGAGGVGGLLAISDLPSSNSHFPAFDGNGNVTALVDATSPTTALYEFNPFGGPIRCEGAFAKANPFRFSTKFTDDETGLLYYGYRYYSPTLARWISRDPIQEIGGLNVYAFCHNKPVSHYDNDGRIAPLLIAYVIFEIVMTAWDLYDAIDTITDPDADLRDVLFSTGGLAAGAVLPGGGYGKIADATYTVGEHALKKLTKRGWTNEMVDDVVKKPFTTRKSTGKSGNPATVYYREDGSHVVKDDVTGEIFHVSKVGDKDWIPDPRIQDPYIPGAAK
jgi:RHS repeat-associated protein